MINKFSDIEGSFSLAGSLFKKNVAFYKIEFSEKRGPEVTECIKIDKKLDIKLFFKGCPEPLPQWFRQGTDCRLTRKSMLENFPVCLRTSYADNHSLIFEELLQYRYKKKPIYPANIIRYSLLWRYTSLSNRTKSCFKIFRYRLYHYCKISVVESSMLLNVQMIFDEMCLQKSQEYFWGEMTGFDDEGELYKGIV